MAFVANGFDITIDRFDHGVNLVWNLKHADGSDYDLTGYEAQIIIKKNAYDPDTTAIFDSTISGSGSSISFLIEDDLASNPSDTYHYAIRLIKGDFVDTILQAKFKICGNTFAQGV